MSYYNININALDNMITEYKNLRDSLEKCGGVLSKSVVGLSVDVYAGMDADILRTAWGIQSTDTIPNIGELLNGVISILEDSLNEYKECKCYCDNMINVFEDYSDVCCSPDSMSGDVMCDTDRIEAAVEAETNIGDEKCEIAEDIANAIRIVEGLNYSQNGVLMALEALAEENSKYNQYSYHLFQLKMYRQKMVEADDHLRDKLAGLNSCLDVGLNEEFVPEGKALEGYSPEVIQAAMILAKGNPTKADEEFLDSLFLTDGDVSREDYILFMNVVGDLKADNWNLCHARAMAEAYTYGMDNKDCELLTMFFGCVTTYDSKVYFDEKKLGLVLAYIDPHDDGTAYFTGIRCLNIPEEQLGVHACVSVKMVDGCLRIEYSPSGYQATQCIELVDMFDAIPDGAYENMSIGWGMNDEEIVDFLSCFYSDDDIAKLCELSCIEQGNEEQYVAFFSENDSAFITPALYPAMADFSYHLGKYGTDEFANELDLLINSISKSDKSNINYLNALAEGFDIRRIQSKDSYNDYYEMQALETLFISIDYCNEWTNPIINKHEFTVYGTEFIDDYRIKCHYVYAIDMLDGTSECNSITVDVNGMITNTRAMGIDKIEDIRDLKFYVDNRYYFAGVETAKFAGGFYDPIGYPMAFWDYGSTLYDINKSSDELLDMIQENSVNVFGSRSSFSVTPKHNVASLNLKNISDWQSPYEIIAIEDISSPDGIVLMNNLSSGCFFDCLDDKQRTDLYYEIDNNHTFKAEVKKEDIYKFLEGQSYDEYLSEPGHSPYTYRVLLEEFNTIVTDSNILEYEDFYSWCSKQRLGYRYN